MSNNADRTKTNHFHITIMTLPFHILDVFTATPFFGNPLAIVTIVPSITLTSAQKQLIAKEFNLVIGDSLRAQRRRPNRNI
jgi:hypothetical protein